MTLEDAAAVLNAHNFQGHNDWVATDTVVRASSIRGPGDVIQARHAILAAEHILWIQGDREQPPPPLRVVTDVDRTEGASMPEGEWMEIRG